VHLQFFYKGNDKSRFTVVLCINASGYLDVPIVIKKGKTDRCYDKVIIPDSITAFYNDSGWIDIGTMMYI
jgi:hypothetical protein